MSDDVEYEFVKGQGWVPKLKQKEKFALGDFVKILEERELRRPGRFTNLDDGLLDAYEPFAARREARGRDVYDFEMFCRDVRIERVGFTDDDIYRATYQRRGQNLRDTYGRVTHEGARAYTVEFHGGDVRVRNEAMRQLYNEVYGIDTRRCARCGTRGYLQRIDDRYLVCRCCGRDQRG